MTDPSNPKGPKRERYSPRPETLALLKVSGNPINGLGETTPRRPSPFFWHPPDQHLYGELQIAARQSMTKCPGYDQAFASARNHPKLIPVTDMCNQASAEQLTREATAFALANEADGVGVTPMDPLYVFEGYKIDEPWVILLALAHDYERLKQVPSDETNGVGLADVGDCYSRGTRASHALANWIRSQGYNASAYPGPSASALLLIPPAIAAGLGELGKHGSLISRHFGSGVRLAGVTTDMPLVATHPTVSAGMNSARPVRSAPGNVPPMRFPNTSKRCAAWSAGTWTSISASRTSRKRRGVGSVLRCVHGRGRTCAQSCSQQWRGASLTMIALPAAEAPHVCRKRGCLIRSEL